MSISNLLEKVAHRQKHREKIRVEDYLSLVRAIAAGQEPDAEHVDAVLQDADKSLDELRIAVERLQKRIEMKAQLDLVPKLEAEQAELEAKFRKADEILNAAEAKHTETTNPLRWRLDEIKAAIQQTWSLTGQMVQTCPYPELVERAKTIAADRSEASGEVSRLREQIEAQRRVIQDCQYRAEKSEYKPHKQEYLERAKHREAHSLPRWKRSSLRR